MAFVMIRLVISLMVLFLVTSLVFNSVYAFKWKIIINVEDATDEMGKMKVKVTVKEKGHTFSDDKGVTKSKKVDIGKAVVELDDTDFEVAKFKFKGVHVGDKYIACIGEACHDSTTIKNKKTVREYISVEGL